MKALAPRAVIVTRPTELSHLVRRHGTRAQARFVLESWGRSFEETLDQHEHFESVLTQVTQSIPAAWRSARITREDLSRFVWDPGDIVLAVGQDGLVANVAKYLNGQPVIGINPDPKRFDGVLVRHPVANTNTLLRMVSEDLVQLEERTLVEARLADGQTMRALNEIYIGHQSHQSSRYTLSCGERRERQSSSGVIVATGTGASGWARSITLSRQYSDALPAPCDRALCFFVREAFPSVATQTSLTEGRIDVANQLSLTSELSEGGVIFGDGVEDDRLRIGWGVTVEVGVSKTSLRLLA